MKKTLAIAFGLLLVASPAFAGPNPDVEFAMHVICSDAFLYCEDLCPIDCLGIDNDALPAELDPTTYGYAYVAFGCYNFTNITAAEFALTGVPGRSMPAMNYCPSATATAFGDPWDTGVAVALGVEIVPEYCGDMFCFGWCYVTTRTLALPFTISYVPSTYTEPVGNKVAGPGPDFVVDLANSEHGCTIGGPHWEPAPYPDCDPGVTADEATTWSGVKSMYR